MLDHSKVSDAESMVLGAVFLDSDIIHEIHLEPTHFISERNKNIFNAMRNLASENVKVDITTLSDKLGDSEEISYLTELAVACPSAENIEAYQQIVIEDYKRRTLVASASNFLNSQSLEAADEFYKTYIEMEEVGRTSENSKVDTLIEIREEMYTDKGDLTGIDTGFTDLNTMTGGLNGGDLIIVAGRPSMGKTAFAMNLAKACCMSDGIVDVFSLEMPEKQLVQRMLSSIGNIEGSKWRNPYRLFSDKDRRNADQAIGVYDSWQINIHDESKQTIADIRSKIRITKRENPHRNHLVVIDYLQLITHVGHFERHDLVVGEITRELKQMARQFDIPIILLSQLSRSVEQRQDKRPMMSDLRDSGSIEQDADLIMFLYRDDYYNVESDQKNVVEVILAKQRNGPIGTVQLYFQKEFSKFLDLSIREAE